MSEDVIFICKIPFWIKGENGYEIPTGSRWLLIPVSPEGYDIALETVEEDSAFQIYMDFSYLDKHFVKGA